MAGSAAAAERRPSWPWSLAVAGDRGLRLSQAPVQATYTAYVVRHVERALGAPGMTTWSSRPVPCTRPAAACSPSRPA